MRRMGRPTAGAPGDEPELAGSGAEASDTRPSGASPARRPGPVGAGRRRAISWILGMLLVVTLVYLALSALVLRMALTPARTPAPPAAKGKRTTARSIQLDTAKEHLELPG